MEPAEAERVSERGSPSSSLAARELSERPKLSERCEAVADRSPGSCTAWELLAGGSGALEMFGGVSLVFGDDVLDRDWDDGRESDGGVGWRCVGERLGDPLAAPP